ncbi:hypothetical protein Trydic_g5000 [Trypoxylus dichotomus]
MSTTFRESCTSSAPIAVTRDICAAAAQPPPKPCCSRHGGGKGETQKKKWVQETDDLHFASLRSNASKISERKIPPANSKLQHDPGKWNEIYLGQETNLTTA